LKKHKLHMNEDELAKFVRSMKIDSVQTYYLRIAREEVEVDTIVGQLKERGRVPAPIERPKKEPSILTSFIRSARDSLGGIRVFGSRDDFMHHYAKCCNPIPGDDIVGFVTTGEGIKIHRKQCKNVDVLRTTDEERIVEVSWPMTDGAEFLAAVRVSGQDRPRMLSDITNAISACNNTNIRAVNIDSEDRLFDGTIIVYVKNIEHLHRLMEKIGKIKGVLKVQRFVEANEKGVMGDGAT
ncbi:MAG: ACT domain-containing protein, partial [Bacteroidota bacterium]